MKEKPEWNVQNEEYPWRRSWGLKERDFLGIKYIDHNGRKWELREPIKILHIVIDVRGLENRLKHHRHWNTCRNELYEWHHHCSKFWIFKEILWKHSEAHHACTEQHKCEEELHHEAEAVDFRHPEPYEEAYDKCCEDHPDKSLYQKAKRVYPRLESHHF